MIAKLKSMPLVFAVVCAAAAAGLLFAGRALWRWYNVRSATQEAAALPLTKL